MAHFPIRPSSRSVSWSKAPLGIASSMELMEEEIWELHTTIHSLQIQLGGLSSQVLMVLASNTSRMNA